MKNMMIFPSLDDDEQEPKLVFPVQNFHRYHLLIAKKAEAIIQETCWFELSTINNGSKTNMLQYMHRYLDIESLDIKNIIFTDCKNIQERAKTFPNSTIIVSKNIINEISSDVKTLDFLFIKNIKLLSMYKSLPIIYHDFFRQNRILNLI